MGKPLTQLDKFHQAACDLEADPLQGAPGGAPRNVAASPAPKRADGRKVCPVCGHVFQGNGWDGIDAHWRARHEAVMPYEEAWPLLKAGTYARWINRRFQSARSSAEPARRGAP